MGSSESHLIGSGGVIHLRPGPPPRTRLQDILALHEGFDKRHLQGIDAVPVVRLAVRRSPENGVADSQQTMESVFPSWRTGEQAPEDVVSSCTDWIQSGPRGRSLQLYRLDPVVTGQSPRMRKHLHKHEGRYGDRQQKWRLEADMAADMAAVSIFGGICAG